MNILPSVQVLHLQIRSSPWYSWQRGIFLAAYATYWVTLSSILSCMSLCTLIHLNNIWTIFAQYLQNVLQYLRNICTIFAQYLDYICMLFVKYSNNIWSNWNKAIYQISMNGWTIFVYLHIICTILHNIWQYLYNVDTTFALIGQTWYGKRNKDKGIWIKG